MYNRVPVWTQNALVSVYGGYLQWKRFGGSEETAKLIAEAASWSGQQIHAYQNRRFLATVAHCLHNVPYYRAAVAAHGVSLSDLRGLDDLAKLPVLPRETVRQQGQALNADRATAYWTQHTSGSSGTPIVVGLNKATYQLVHALLRDHERRHGVGPRDLRATFAGRLVQPVTDQRPPFWRYNRAEHQMLFSAYHMSDATLPLYVEELRRRQPVELIGYPSAIHALANFAEQAGERGFIRPTVVITNSETLFAWQRQTIERVFECRVADYYGSAEAVAFGAQCDHGVYHFNPLLGFVEVMRPDGTPCSPGEQGRLVCSTLMNDVTPLVRYEVGDEGIPAPEGCACGSHFQGVLQVVGRTDENIVTRDGRAIGRVDHIFKGVVGIRECQVVQEDLSTIRLLLAADASFDEAQRAVLVSNLEERVGPGFSIVIETVESVPRTSRGKFKGVVNKVRSARPDAASADR
jgi:phenylacetate-CoA ligase